MTALPLTEDRNDCWNRIGVWGDRSCPELIPVVHCHNCPVFQAAGRRFLASPAPEGYLEAWTVRLAEKEAEGDGDGQGVLIFRLGEEWLALPVAVLREVVSIRTIRRIPFQSALLAGMVNVRGELYLSIRMDSLLGIADRANGKDTKTIAETKKSEPRLLVAGREEETWVFRVDEVDRVHRLTTRQLQPVPPTLGRAASRLTRGVFACHNRAVGLLDERRLFEVVRASMR
jgi:chemotaxis-related protein WspD